MEANLSKSSSDLHHNSVLFKNFSSRRFSRDMLVSSDEYLTPSTEDDGQGHHEEGPSLAIPFTWETQPGTPKVKFHQRKFPPLTPPPSYFYCTPSPTRSTKNPKPSFLRTIFPRLRSKKSHSPESPASSSSSSSFSSWSSSPWPSATRSVPASPVTTPVAVNNLYHGRASMSSYRLPLDTNMNDVVEHDSDSGCSTPLCFGLSGGRSPRSRGCYLAMIKVLHGRLP